MPNMALSFNRSTFQFSKSEEQLGKRSDVALSILFSNHFGSFLVDFVSILTIDLKYDRDLNM